MPAMVIVVAAVAVFTLGLVGVAVVVIRRSLLDLRRTVDVARQELEPLRQQLEAEQATMQLELDGLQRRQRGDRDAPAPPHHRQ